LFFYEHLNLGKFIKATLSKMLRKFDMMAETPLKEKERVKKIVFCFIALADFFL